MPQTLGECLEQVRRRNGQSYDEAAVEIGAPVEDVRAWAQDERVPGSEVSGLAPYLDVKPEAIHGLALRSQMRRAERRIHGLVAS
jgi:hypothetical protein